MFNTGLMSELAGDGGWIYSIVRSKSLYTRQVYCDNFTRLTFGNKNQIKSV